ncbi:MAG TPA: hypothetical protein DCP91_05090 [Eggerthellaceae bacterium]|nr:hypothetical protein [Eggerthellaceae bacterium]
MTLQDSPAVSVLVPVYNMERYLRQCLESLCAQTLEDIEIIAIDDGSTDSSPQILEEFARRDSRIRVLSKDNTGYGDSMNRGLAEARGEFIGIVEPDDFVSPDMYATYVRVAHAAQADVVKSNYFEHIDERDRQLNLYKDVGIAYGQPFNPADHPLVITVRPSIWSGMYRRSLLQERAIRFAPTPGASFQDTSFCHMCWMAAKRAVVIETCHVHYRVEVQGSSSTSGQKLNAVFQEFARSRAFLQSCDPAVQAAFGPVLGPLCYGNCVWHFNRVAPEAKLEFARLWSAEMANARESGAFANDLLSIDMRNDLLLLEASPESYVERYAQQAPWQDFDYQRSGRTSAGSLQPDSKLTIVAQRPEHPDITVVVPIFKVERYVRECVESLLAQSFANFEVICVDDGSPDASGAIARSASRGDARFVWLSQENGGQSSARNLAIEHARGTYLLCLDADDLYAPDALEKLHARAAADDLDYLDFTAHTFYETAHMRRVNNEDSFELRTDVAGVMSGAALFVEYMRRDEYFCSECLHFFKKDLLDCAQLRFAPGIIHEDELFSPLLIAHAQRAAFLNEPLYLRRMRADSTMTAVRGLRNLHGVLHDIRTLDSWLREHWQSYSREFAAALAQRIAFLGEVAINDARMVNPDDLNAYEEGLEGEDVIYFNLYVRGGLKTCEHLKAGLEFHRIRGVGRRLLAWPRALKDALEDRRNR